MLTQKQKCQQSFDSLESYDLKDGKFKIDSEVYLIRTRKKPTPKKPPQFVVKTSPKFEYISSLYPTNEENIFTLDYQGSYYKALLTGEKIQILPENE